MRKKILFVGSEALPFASSGGLGDVIGSLPASLMSEYPDELDVRVIMPLYKSVQQKYREMMRFICSFEVPLAWRKQYCGLFELKYNGVIFYFVDNEYYFLRDSLYGNFDDGERFAFFCKAVMESMPKINFFPDILHAHDWQSALSVIYLKRKYNLKEEYKKIKAIFTIHNIEYQGKYETYTLWDVFELPDEDLAAVEYGGYINLMKGAIECADKVTTVSERYAEEIKSSYFSHGLHFILQKNDFKLSGIINGIDYDYYNPETDPDIYMNYTSEEIGKKSFNKQCLLQELGLPVSDSPVIAMITRLTAHKGLDLVSWASEKLMSESNAQFVLLGTGEKGYESYFAYLKDRFPDRVSVNFKFDKAFSKKIYAGADIFLMPSKSEPCGLSQMIASRYGTVPVVRQTGGLYDTIHEGENGFTFYAYNGDEMLKSVFRAVNSYYDRQLWSDTVRAVMNKDFSWKNSAKKYYALYTKQ